MREYYEELWRRLPAELEPSEWEVRRALLQRELRAEDREALLLIASRSPLRDEDGSVAEGSFRGFQRASLLNSRGVVTIEAGTPIGQAHVSYLLVP